MIASINLQLLTGWFFLNGLENKHADDSYLHWPGRCGEGGGKQGGKGEGGGGGGLGRVIVLPHIFYFVVASWIPLWSLPTQICAPSFRSYRLSLFKVGCP